MVIATQSKIMNSNFLKEKLWIFPLIILIVALIAWLFAGKFFSHVLVNFQQLKNIFWAVAFGWSTFLALYAFQLHNRQYADNPKDVQDGYGKLRWSQRIHQFILNFLGGLIGWVIIYLFLYSAYFTSFEGWEKIILLFVSFLAIMGYLPYTLIIKSWLPSK